MNRTSRLIVGLMLVLMSLSSSCALLQAAGPPQLENRTLRISIDVPGFEYQWEVCSERFLGICTKHKMVKETYDLTDLEVRKKLMLMGFVLRVREKL
jgi:hypothetical protein